ncbi:MAG TPA: DUF4474 domain-containing protein [Candidatus Fimivicinus intestinavium]|nr:DUF4474 domain-containing protein [Candidatus Fimivicinus intestinavium]
MMTTWMTKALSAALAALMLLVSPMPAAVQPEAEVELHREQQEPAIVEPWQAEKTTAASVQREKTEEAAPVRQEAAACPLQAADEANSIAQGEEEQEAFPARTDAAQAEQNATPESPEASEEKPSLADLGPQFWEIVDLTLHGKFMSSQNPKLIAFAQPFYEWLSNNDYFDINIVYDEDRNVFRDDGLRGIVAIGFDYDATQGIYFSAHDPWMRALGYCEFYDQIAPYFGYTLDTKRFKFDYDGYEWMFQVWKGEYLWCATGAEMGLYYREPGSTLTDDFYYTVPDEQMINMEMTLYHDGNYKFKREMEETWWQTGFIFCYMCEPEEVTIEARVEFPNEEMRNAFLPALEEQGYVLGETYTVEGNIVSFAY